MFLCPVCYFDKMPDPPQDFNICPCCGTEFGLDDELKSHTQLRYEWIMGGMKWFFHDPPPFWSPTLQLERVSVPCVVPVLHGMEAGVTVHAGVNLYGTPYTATGFLSGYVFSSGSVNAPPPLSVYSCFDMTAPVVTAANDYNVEQFDRIVTNEEDAPSLAIAA